jgi:exodeoxyribonuclease-3
MRRAEVVKIATFNVNGINGRLAVLLRWLSESKPDVVCLQEIKASDDNFPAVALRDAGYGSVWHGQKSWNGVAILARDTDPIETRRGLPGDPDDTHTQPLSRGGDQWNYHRLPLPAEWRPGTRAEIQI